jgi:hypothetical protein
MTSKERQELEAHLNAVAKILYKNTNPEQLQDFESIELVAREHLLTEIAPKLGEFAWCACMVGFPDRSASAFSMQASHLQQHEANK